MPSGGVLLQIHMHISTHFASHERPFRAVEVLHWNTLVYFRVKVVLLRLVSCHLWHLFLSLFTNVMLMFIKSRYYFILNRFIYVVHIGGYVSTH